MIDAHQHYWCIGRPDCNWPAPELKAIYRDWLPSDYHADTVGLSVEGTVLVQSQSNDGDTDFLLALAEKTPNVKAVVGWADLSSRDFGARLNVLKKHSKFRGVRPMLQNIKHTNWILQPSLNSSIQQLVDNEVCFDALIEPRHLQTITTLAERFSRLKIVIDHGAKPNIKQHEFTEWAAEISILAQHSNVYCKLSGLVTEAESSQWLSVEEFFPYIAHLFETFGSSRLMWGSDWPVVNIATGVEPWVMLLEKALKRYCEEKEIGEEAYLSERNSIFSGTASYFYQI